MEDFDFFCGDLIEQSKRFLEKAKEIKEDKDAIRSFFNASLLLSISALEAYINSISKDFFTIDGMNILEKSILSERDFHLVDGRFELSSQLKIYRTTDKIEFLYRKFSGEKLKDSKLQWWLDLKSSIDLRNKIVHPKDNFQLTEDNVEKALSSVIDCINKLYMVIYSKKLPIYNKGLQSRYNF